MEVEVESSMRELQMRFMDKIVTKFNMNPEMFPIDEEGNVKMRHVLSSLEGEGGETITFLLCASEFEFFGESIETGKAPTKIFNPANNKSNEYHLVYGCYRFNPLAEATIEKQLAHIEDLIKPLNDTSKHHLFEYVGEDQFIEFSVRGIELCGIDEDAERFAVALLIEFGEDSQIDNFKYPSEGLIFDSYVRYRNLDSASNLLNRYGVFSMTHHERDLTDVKGWREYVNIQDVVNVASSMP